LRRGLAAAAGISFCSLEQSVPFTEAKLISRHTHVAQIPETSSRFTPGDRQLARRTTGVFGEPAVLSVGHLDENKDPLTVLEGISAAVDRLPGLQLWCCYGKAPLDARVRARMAADPRLLGRVHLLGRLAHPMIEQMMRAADLFVQGSHHEGSGCALVEALACGLPPVVTDIPSFRALTANGSVGALWPCEDARRLSDALVAAASQPNARALVEAHFQSELSCGAVGRRLIALYESLCGGMQAAAAEAAAG
jgi:glycosyltransferase involved in cell wall biosynthesis